MSKASLVHCIKSGTYIMNPSVYKSIIGVGQIAFIWCPGTGVVLYCIDFYPPTKSEGYGFGVVRASVRLSVRPFRPSVCTFCLSGTISQYLLVRFNSFLVQIISTISSRYPISLVKIDSLTLELLPLFKYMQL